MAVGLTPLVTSGTTGIYYYRGYLAYTLFNESILYILSLYFLCRRVLRGERDAHDGSRRAARGEDREGWGSAPARERDPAPLASGPALGPSFRAFDGAAIGARRVQESRCHRNSSNDCPPCATANLRLSHSRAPRGAIGETAVPFITEWPRARRAVPVRRHPRVDDGTGPGAPRRPHRRRARACPRGALQLITGPRCVSAIGRVSQPAAMVDFLSRAETGALAGGFSRASGCWRR